MRLIGEILRSPEAEGAGAATQAAGSGTDTIASAAGADTQSAAAATETQSAAAANDSVAAAAGADTQSAGAAAAAQPDWRDRRIATLTARLAEARSAPKPAAAAASAQPDPVADFNRRVSDAAQAQAAQMVERIEFNRKCNEAATAGTAKFGAEAFNASVKNLQMLVDPGDQAANANYEDFLSSAIETGEGAVLLYELGRDMNEAQRILGLDPRRRAIELTKKAQALASAASADVSALPKPITEVQSHGARHDTVAADDSRSDTLDTAEWMRRRNAQVESRARG